MGGRAVHESGSAPSRPCIRDGPQVLGHRNGKRQALDSGEPAIDRQLRRSGCLRRVGAAHAPSLRATPSDKRVWSCAEGASESCPPFRAAARLQGVQGIEAVGRLTALASLAPQIAFEAVEPLRASEATLLASDGLAGREGPSL